MGVVRHRLRVRIVTNPKKHKRHRRRRMIRRLRQAAWWGGVLTLVAAILWMVITVMSHPPRTGGYEPERGCNALGY